MTILITLLIGLTVGAAGMFFYQRLEKEVLKILMIS